MKVWISADMEGVAGVVSWEQCREGPSYALGCALLLGEVTAAVEGALAGGATEVVVNDSHGAMANLDPARLPAPATYVSGRNKPDYMCEGLDATVDVALFVGYHGGIHTGSNLSHTYNPGAVGEVRIDGVAAGESGINALATTYYDVPVVLITGDQFVRPEAEPFLPGIEVVEVKRSISRTAAESLHPEVARHRIREATARAVQRTVRQPVPALQLEVDWLTTDQADAVPGAVAGAERTGPRTTRLTAPDGLQLYRDFCTALVLTRHLTV